MIVQYWIVIPNRVKFLAKKSRYSSIAQNYITLLVTEWPSGCRTAEQGDKLASPHIRSQAQETGLYRLRRVL
jgi:hypothetical protein